MSDFPKGWKDPFETLGGRCYEWWEGNRKLTIYRNGEGFDFVRSWGPCTQTQMDDGFVDSDEGFDALWSWLHEEQKKEG